MRTNLAASDAAYNCVFEAEDEQGVRGIRLSKELMAIAGESLKANITTLGPMVLPVSEQLLFAANIIARKLFGKKKFRPYVPDFSLAFNHICIHTGMSLGLEAESPATLMCNADAVHLHARDHVMPGSAFKFGAH